ncbi:MAG: hypothetical protein AAGJ35_03350, partial [Myxococcota bacterium]
SLNQLLLKGHLEEIAYGVDCCTSWEDLPLLLARFGSPHLVVFDASRAADYLSMLQKQFYPLLRAATIPCLGFGFSLQPDQDEQWSAWYKDAFLCSTTTAELTQKIKELTLHGVF